MKVISSVASRRLYALLRTNMRIILRCRCVIIFSPVNFNIVCLFSFSSSLIPFSTRHKSPVPFSS